MIDFKISSKGIVEDIGNRRLFIVGKSKKVVQVYVHANDGKWYLQEAIRHIAGELWCVYVVLGNESSPAGQSYGIIAVQTADRPESPLMQLPDVPKSNTLTVTT